MPYPPVLFWKEDIKLVDVIDSWEKTVNYIQTSKKNHNMWLYVHIPFCYTHCFFCTCVTKVEHNQKKYDEYLDLIEKESNILSEVFKEIKFNTVYVWWGTPTILTPEQMDRFYTILKTNFNLSQVSQIMTEWSPYTTTEDKMKVLSAHGVNKMTFWVQSLDSNTLKTNNRFQQFNDVKNAVDLARNYGIEYINLDIMAWIPWQDIDGFKETVDLIQTLNPTTVHVNSFWPTKNTNFMKTWWQYSYENIKLRNEMEKYGKFLEDMESKITDTRKKNLQLYNSHNYNSSILWLWYGAISHSFGQLHYSKTSFLDYKNSLLGDEWVRFLGYRLTLDDEVITYLINNLRGGVYLDKFEELFWLKLSELKVFGKVEYLLEKWMLVYWKDENHWDYIKFKYNSDIYNSVYSKFLFEDSLIKEFWKYMIKHSNEFDNLDLRLKQFFTD